MAADLSDIAGAISAESENISDKGFRKALQIRCAELYRLHASSASGEKAAASLLNASRLFLKADDDAARAESFVCATMLVQNHGASSYAPEGMLIIGEIYAGIREYGKAVKTWIECADKYPKASEIASESLLRAGDLFRKSIKNKVEAEKQYSRLISTYPASKNASLALMNRAEINDEEKRYDMAVTDYLTIARKMTTDEIADTAMYEAIEITEDNIKDFKKAYELTVEFKQKFPNSAHLKKVERMESRLVKYAGGS